MDDKTQRQFDESKSRRSRKDEEGRDYKCGCGKKYLSYPALYTHIKTKHEGRQPEGTQKTVSSSSYKRVKTKFQSEALKDIFSYLQPKDLRVLSELDDGFKGQIAFASRIRRENLPKEIFDSYNNLIKQLNVKLTRNSSLDTVLTVYLMNVGEYVNQRLYNHYLNFARILRKCYYDHGDEVYEACFSKKDSGVGYLPNFNVEEVKYVPIICDFMVRYFIPNEERNVNLSLIELMLADFCYWLKSRSLTCIEVNLNKPYHLQNALKTEATTQKLQDENRDVSISSNDKPKQEQEDNEDFSHEESLNRESIARNPDKPEGDVERKGDEEEIENRDKASFNEA